MARSRARGNAVNPNAVNERVANYRVRADREGLKRVETTVSAQDVNLMKDVARVLREDGDRAGELRDALRSLLPVRRARTGAELLAFFQEFPAAEEGEDEPVEFERDNSSGREIDLG